MYRWIPLRAGQSGRALPTTGGSDKMKKTSEETVPGSQRDYQEWEDVSFLGLSPGKLLRSHTLALFLFLVIALLAVKGSLFSPAQWELYYFKSFGRRFLPMARFFGLIDTYRSPVFLSLMALLCLNLVLCTWNRFTRRREASSRAGGGRAAAVRWLDLAMHVSVLILLAGGAAKGLWGFTGTQNIHVGFSTDTVFDWSLQADMPLGFTIAIKEQVREHYPIQARIGISETGSGRKLTLLEVWEGRWTKIEGSDLELEVSGLDNETKVLSLRAGGAGPPETLFFETVPGGRTSASFGDYRLTLVAFRQDLKSVRSRVAILEGDVRRKEGWLLPNSRMSYQGTSIYQTAWGTDDYGSRYTGIQVSRDPGAIVFWSGSILLSLSLPFFILARRRR
jgi:hypothetical protein